MICIGVCGAIVGILPYLLPLLFGGIITVFILRGIKGK